jgi:hypothetical protein
VDLYEFKVRLVYRASSRIAKGTQRNPVSKNKNNNNNKKEFKGWRDGSVVKGTDCSPRGPKFNS